MMDSRNCYVGVSHFPFPSNPVDGQQVSHLQTDGSVLTATYDAAKGRWTVERQLPPTTPVTGSDPIAVTPTADRQVITWDANLQKWTAAAIPVPKLRELSDVTQHDTPHLGAAPIFSYAAGHTAAEGRWMWGTQPAHLKNWDSTVHWESGATVFHRGYMWRATQDNSNVEPVLEDGKVMLFIHADGEPTFGLVPVAVDAAAPPSGTQPAGAMRYAYWLQYTDDTTMSVWKFVIKGKDPSTHNFIGEWEGRPWHCIAWRNPVAPPPHFPSGIVMVWIHDQEGGIHQPIVGQQKWAKIDLSISIGMATDVDAPHPKNHDLLVYNGTMKRWINMSKADFMALP